MESSITLDRKIALQEQLYLVDCEMEWQKISRWNHGRRFFRPKGLYGHVMALVVAEYILGYHQVRPQLYTCGSPLPNYRNWYYGIAIGNRFAIVFQDLFTKWPLVFATPNQKIERIAKLLAKEVVPMFGISEALLRIWLGVQICHLI